MGNKSSTSKQATEVKETPPHDDVLESEVCKVISNFLTAVEAVLSEEGATETKADLVTLKNRVKNIGDCDFKELSSADMREIEKYARQCEYYMQHYVQKDMVSFFSRFLWEERFNALTNLYHIQKSVSTKLDISRKSVRREDFEVSIRRF